MDIALPKQSAFIMHNGEKTYLGKFHTRAEASAAIREARSKLKGVCPCGTEFKMPACFVKFCPEHRAWAIMQRTHYGFDDETLVLLLTIKEDGCFICGSTHLLSVDHCHTTGNARGWLCRRCNAGLGMFEDNIERMKMALSYLEAAV